MHFQEVNEVYCVAGFIQACPLCAERQVFTKGVILILQCSMSMFNVFPRGHFTCRNLLLISEILWQGRRITNGVSKEVKAVLQRMEDEDFFLLPKMDS